MKFLVREMQNLQSSREGVEIDVKSLRSAKIIAERNRCFFGTVLVIEDPATNDRLAEKSGKNWVTF